MARKGRILIVYEKSIDTLEGLIELEVGNDMIVMECEDHWKDFTSMTLTIHDAKRLRNYLTEAINFATMNKEEEK